MATEYHKIAGPFKRNPDNLKSLTATFVSPVVEMLADAPIWLFTEKLDGMNMRIIWDGHRITYGGRTDKADIPGDLVKWLDARMQQPGVEEWFEENFGETEVVLVGEGVGPGIQKDGARYGDHKHFVGFDVIVAGKYLSYENARDILGRFDLNPLPLIGDGYTLYQIINDVSLRLVGLEGGYIPEGVVAITPHPLYDQRGNRVIVKIKDVDFHRG